MPHRILSVRERAEPFTVLFEEGEQWKMELKRRVTQTGLDETDFAMFAFDGRACEVQTVTDSMFPLQLVPVEGKEYPNKGKDWKRWSKTTAGVTAIAEIKGARAIDTHNEQQGLEMRVNNISVYENSTSGHSFITAIVFHYANGRRCTFGNPTPGGRPQPLRFPGEEYLTGLTTVVHEGRLIGCCFLSDTAHGLCSKRLGKDNSSGQAKTFKAAAGCHIVSLSLPSENMAEIVNYIGVARKGYLMPEFKVAVVPEWLPMPSFAARGYHPSRTPAGPREPARRYDLVHNGQKLKDVGTQRRVLVFGDAGTGKSTLLSALCGFTLTNDGFAVQEESSGDGVTKRTHAIECDGRLYLDMPGMEQSANDLVYLEQMKLNLGKDSKDDLGGWYINHFLLVAKANESRFVRLERMLLKLCQHFGYNIVPLITVVFTNASTCRTQAGQKRVIDTFRPYFEAAFGSVNLMTASDDGSACSHDNDLTQKVKCVFIDTPASLPDQEDRFSSEERLEAQTALERIKRLIDETQKVRLFTHCWPAVVDEYLGLKVTYEAGCSEDVFKNIMPQLMSKGSVGLKWMLHVRKNGQELFGNQNPLVVDIATGALGLKPEENLKAGRFELTLEIEAGTSDFQAADNLTVIRLVGKHTATLHVALNKEILIERLRNKKSWLTCPWETYEKYKKQVQDEEDWLLLPETQEAIGKVRENCNVSDQQAIGADAEHVPNEQLIQLIETAVEDVVRLRTEQNHKINDVLKQISVIQDRCERKLNSLNEELYKQASRLGEKCDELAMEKRQFEQLAKEIVIFATDMGNLPSAHTLYALCENCDWREQQSVLLCLAKVHMALFRKSSEHFFPFGPPRRTLSLAIVSTAEENCSKQLRKRFGLGANARVTHVTSRSGLYLDQITFHYEDGTSLAFGGLGGTASRQWTVPDGDCIVRMESRHGESHDGCRFTTNSGAQSPWFGNAKGGVLYEYVADEGNHITGLVMQRGSPTDYPTEIIQKGHSREPEFVIHDPVGQKYIVGPSGAITDTLPQLPKFAKDYVELKLDQQMITPRQ
eukprot:TRINITY_DN29350_c0_g1_i1.p1 TRINITY_DN29350_c0_g1~~TRINITY_DN29350_c0_g1_i1.p1  ORF type:complete len:1179 (+),score=142.38 TRINITY_DN29350_c0_g1_i1:396-3539(+)